MDIIDTESLIVPKVPDPTLEEEDTATPAAVNLYVTAPAGNRLAVPEEEEEPVYSTVRKFRNEVRHVPDLVMNKGQFPRSLRGED